MTGPSCTGAASRRFDVERDAAQTRMRQLARRLGRAVAPLPAGARG
jgi:hypothetical protein